MSDALKILVVHPEETTWWTCESFGG